MDPQAESAKRRTLSGRWLVLVIVVLGAGMGLAGFLLRAARGPSLPLKPGSLVVVTCETATRGDEDGASDPRWTRFSLAVAPSSELVANLGSLFTGKMPRESGLVREGDALRADLPTLAEIVEGQGFAAAAFVASGAVEWKKAGLLRGFSSVDANAGAPDAELAAKAAEWLLARGTSPSLAWLHGRSDEAVDGFVARLHERGVDDHAVVVTAGPLAPGAGGRIRLAIRLPVALLPLRVDPEPVSLIDIVASVAEVFGVRAPDGIGTPFLLHPDIHGPHFVLSTRPLSGEFADADEVWLRTTQLESVNAPLSGGPEADTPLAKELRTVVEDGFGYRFEEVELAALRRADRMGSQNAASVPPAGSALSRVRVARSKRQSSTK